jgi:16S rRNA G966 N2-methylase RsmD
MLEHDAGLVTQLLATKSRLEAAAVQVQRGDAVMVLKKTLPGSQDLIFLDPPFDSDLFDKALSAAAQAVAAEGFIYLEAPTAWTDALLQPFGLQVRRHLKAGAVHAHLLVRAVPSASNEETTP